MPRPPAYRTKNPKREGLAFIMNNPKTNPTTPQGRQAFNAINSASGLSLSQTLKHIGQKSRAPAPTEDEKSKSRMSILESDK